MVKKYDYLKKFIVTELFSKTEYCNFFYSVSEEELIKAELSMGFLFPSSLREFYLEVGAGCLGATINDPRKISTTVTNRILEPYNIADILNGFLFDETTNLYFPEEDRSILQDGEIPFLEKGNSSGYLSLKSKSDNPNAVWAWNTKIDDSFEQFIWKLAHEDVEYYYDILEGSLHGHN